MRTNYKLFSPQSNEIYRLLLKKNQLTAKEIGNDLNIFPNAVYRAVKQLVETGFVQENDTYPVTYQIMPVQEAIEMYSLSLLKQLPVMSHNGKQNQFTAMLDISFIKNRDNLIENTDRDIETATRTVDFIVSGHEVSAETMLHYKNAIDRGVTVRVITQRFNEINEQMFRNWQRIGIQVKYYPNMEARIFIIDKKIVIFTSYNPENKEEALGMRFNYQPYAKIMDELFEARWKIAKEI